MNIGCKEQFMETAWKIAIPVVTVAAAAGAAGFSGYRMMEGFLRRHEPYADDPPADEEYTTPSYHKAYLDGLKYNDAIKAEDWTITSKDGLKLVASYIPAEGNAVRNIILCHGYHSSGRKDFSGILQYYHENGANLLMIEERAHRRSEGEYLTMGIRESEDIALWSREMVRKLGDELPMYLHGVSMGAASVLMAEGENLSENLVGVIADCGFTDPLDIAKDVMMKNMGAVTYVALPIINFWAKKKTGLSLDDKSATEILRTAKYPVLFIHGTGDDFVPVHMTIKNYHACAAPKRICLVDGATHAMSWYFDTAKYKRALESFFADFERR